MTPEPLSREHRRQQREDLRKWVSARLAPDAKIYYGRIQADLELDMSQRSNRHLVKPIIEQLGWTCVTIPNVGYRLASKGAASLITRHSVVKTERTITRETRRVEMTHGRFIEEVTTDQRREIEADRQWLYGLATVTHATVLSEEITERVKRTRRRMPAPPPPIEPEI